MGCHGAVFFGSTGQSQLISLSEKNMSRTLINHSRMDVRWTMALVLWLWTLSLRTTLSLSELDRNDHVAARIRTWSTVIVMGALLVLMDAQVVYDDLVSKTRRLVSADAVRSHLTQTLWRLPC